jgi:hypothetical protein
LVSRAFSAAHAQTNDKEMIMPAQRVEIVNYEAFGEKVKAWAKGTAPIPATVEEFKNQLAEANVGAKIPQQLKNVKFVQGDEETLIVRLPAKQMVEDSEQKLSSPGASYPLPPLYEKVFAAKPKIDDLLAFHAARVADYTIAQCG